MSLKAIEMQVALPRTFDAGKIQDQQDPARAIDEQSCPAGHLARRNKKKNNCY